MTKGDLHVYEYKGPIRVCSASEIPLMIYIDIFIYLFISNL